MVKESKLGESKGNIKQVEKRPVSKFKDPQSNMGTVFSACLGEFSTPVPPFNATPPLAASTAKQVNVESQEVTSEEISPKCCFGAGCYWGTDKYFKHDFVEKTIVKGSITNGKVGFMGPKSAPAKPSYEAVCTGRTGHVEVFHCEITGGAPYYEAMVHYFFQFHDPTTMNKQGNDAGTQYASVIYCYDAEQHRIATKVKVELQRLLDLGLIKCYVGNEVTTDIRMVESEFFPAQDGHQEYLVNNPRGYCNHRVRFNEWPLAKELSRD